MFWDRVAGVYDIFVNVINRRTHKRLREIVAGLKVSRPARRSVGRSEGQQADLKAPEAVRKKTREVCMKLFLSLVVYIIGFTVVWNILDFLYSTYITGNGYQFSISSDMITPLTLMLIIQIVQWKRKK